MVERMDQLSYLIPVELFLKYFSIDSSNVNEVISLILNFFFNEKILHAQQAQNAHKRTKIKKAAFLCS